MKKCRIIKTDDSKYVPQYRKRVWFTNKYKWKKFTQSRLIYACESGVFEQDEFVEFKTKKKAIIFLKEKGFEI